MRATPSQRPVFDAPPRRSWAGVVTVRMWTNARLKADKRAALLEVPARMKPGRVLTDLLAE